MKNRGISLIILVLILIVLFTLAATIIIFILNDSPTSQIKEASFKTNVDSYKSQLNKVVMNQYFSDHSFQIGTFDFPVWDGTGDGSLSVKACIPCMTDDDAKKFAVIDGTLVYVGNEQNEIEWLTEIGLVKVK